MNICLISPTKGLEKYSTLSKTHLVLAHVNDEEYKQFYYDRRQRGDFLILDNGAHEQGSSVAWSRLEGAIAFYKPQVCVLPDTLNDGSKTLSQGLRFLDKNLDRWPCEWMFVPQGQGWKNCLLEALKDARVGKAITWVGISRYLALDHSFSRAAVAEWIKQMLPHLKLHALGMVKGSVEEFTVVRESGLFESLDTSVPVWRGWQGYSIYNPKWTEVSVDFSAKEDESKHELIKENLQEVLRVNSAKL